MNKKTLTSSIAAAMCMMLTFASCAKEISGGEEEGGSRNSSLNIVTRSGNADQGISYPIAVYLMNEGHCVATKTISSNSDSLAFKLEAKKYDIYAVGGVTPDKYVLPAQDTASTSSKILLRSGQTHTDLMTAMASADLKDGDDTKVTLTMQRKVLQLQSVTIKQVPKKVTAMQVTILPLYNYLTLNGDYSTEATDSISVALTRQDDQTTWKNADGLYMLAAASGAKIHIQMTINGITKGYAYSCSEQLAANYKVNIEGTFTGNQEIDLSATINGAEWGDDKDITFNFDETNENGGNSSDPNDPNNPNDPNEPQVSTDEVPNVGDFYKDCYVLSKSETSASYVITLLSLDEKEGLYTDGMTDDELQAAINAALPSFDINGISDWVLPTEAEKLIINKNKGSINYDIENHSSGVKLKSSGKSNYFCDQDGTVKAWIIGLNRYDNPDTYSILRPVTKVQFNK